MVEKKKKKINYLISSLEALIIFCLPLIIFSPIGNGFIEPKWIIIYGLTFIAALRLISFSQIEIPSLKVKSLTTIALVSLVVGYGLSIGFNSFFQSTVSLVDWCCFALLILYFYNKKEPLDFQKIAVALLSTAVVFCIIGFLQYFQIYIYAPKPFNNMPSATLGHQNFSAEFIAAVLILLFSNFLKINRKIKFAIVIAFSFYLFLLWSRSTTLALFLAMSVPMFLKIKNVKIRKILTLLTFIGALFFLTWPFFCKDNSTFCSIKHNNSTARLIRWENSLEMFRFRPWGYGPDSFLYSYLPFSFSKKTDFEIGEESLTRTPHNGYIETLVENGWLTTLGLFLILGFMLFKILRIQNPSIKMPLLSFFIFITITAFFAFPMENPPLFFICAFMLGWFLKNTATPYILKSKTYINTALILACIFISTYSFFYAVSNTALSVPTKTPFWFQLHETACKFLPTNSKNCIAISKEYIFYGQYTHAEKLLKSLLEAQPNNFLALKRMSETLFFQGRIKEGCNYLERYDHLFREFHYEKEFYTWQCKERKFDSN